MSERGKVKAPTPERDVGVAVKRDGKFYQIVTVQKGDGAPREVTGRRTDNKIVAAEWLTAAFLESAL